MNRVCRDLKSLLTNVNKKMVFFNEGFPYASVISIYILNISVSCVTLAPHCAMRISTFKSRYLFIRYEIKCHMRHDPWEVVGRDSVHTLS